MDLSALKWRRASDTGYWDETSISEWIQSDGDAAEISYRSLSVLVHHLCRQIYEIILQTVVNDRTVSNCYPGTRLSVPVAVAIPEGFFLPLSAAAAHILNDAERFSVVLIPIDPAEGIVRLQRIIEDCQPLLLLVAADCDVAAMQQLAQPRQEAACSGQLLHVFEEANQPVYLAPSTQVVDVRSLLKGCSSFAEDEPKWTASQRGDFRQQIFGLATNNTQPSRSYLMSRDGNAPNCISHITYTSGSTGFPKGCICSRKALENYLHAKNNTHRISVHSIILLASAVSFDPCFSDVLATFLAGATLFLASRQHLVTRLHRIVMDEFISHVLCTPTLWSSLAIHNVDRSHCPGLQTVALGGEPISPQIIRSWARKNQKDTSNCRLFATYGVTEACVYQTMGEIFVEDSVNVGTPLDGNEVSICQESVQDSLSMISDYSSGEIVLHGIQIDEFSSYLRRTDLTARAFVFDRISGTRYYRSGDRGYISPSTGLLHISGRIQGESGMIKYNGIRVELGEIEYAIVDDESIEDPVVVDCLVKLWEVKETGETGGSRQSLCAYVVLSQHCMVECNLNQTPDCGILCAGDLLALLVARCKRKARVVPTAFIILPRIPLSRTGKRNEDAVPKIEHVIPFSALSKQDVDVRDMLLAEYSELGKRVAEHISDCLNLLPCQATLVTTTSTFAMLGGDSVAATLIVRALYAEHYNVFNGRELGGAYGILDDDAFSASHLLRAKNLGSYVDFLQSRRRMVPKDRSISPSCESQPTTTPTSRDSVDTRESSSDGMYDMLVQSIIQGRISIALSLLEVGASPNRDNGQRLSKTRGVRERKAFFHSTPLHSACLRGDPKLVRALIQKGAKTNVPDAAGMFPLHCASTGGGHARLYAEEEDLRRMECVQILLQAGVPLTIKTGTKQTVVHSAARSGFLHVLEYVMTLWNIEFIPQDPVKFGKTLDWRDHWSRTPVHWAILNGKVDALRVLLTHGCNPAPEKPKKNIASNVALETPKELCERIYGTSQTGLEIQKLLDNPARR